MKRTTSIVLFASIFAVGTLGLGGSSAITLMTAPQSSELVGMLGHVEYKVQDFDGNIIAYMQNDNIVVNDGEDCVATNTFGGAINCTSATNPFNFIGIGNGSSTTIGDTNSTLADTNDPGIGECADNAGGGDMARKQVIATHTAASGTTGAIVVLDTSNGPFTFDSSNDTVVIDSGVFNANYAVPNANGVCLTNFVGGDWDMFSRQLLNGATGITVNDGDSLSVKWTITVG